MGDTQYRREIRLGSRGNDTVAIKRALARAGFGQLDSAGTKAPWFGVFAVKNLKAFQKSQGIPATGVLGRITFSKLLPFFDDYSRFLYAQPEDKALAKARTLLAECHRYDGPYVYGGGHGPPLATLSVHQGLDCSSSTSLALYHVGLMPSSVAQVSGWFESYGSAERGKYVTIHASAVHVWIEFSLPEGYFRFDTSPHGDGGFGPRVRTHPRFTLGFTERHPKGL